MPQTRMCHVVVLDNGAHGTNENSTEPYNGGDPMPNGTFTLCPHGAELDYSADSNTHKYTL